MAFTWVLVIFRSIHLYFLLNASNTDQGLSGIFAKGILFSWSESNSSSNSKEVAKSFIWRFAFWLAIPEFGTLSYQLKFHQKDWN